MRLRAAIIDIYGTLLENESASLQTDSHWEEFWQRHLHRPPRISPAQFSAECDRAIAREHALAQARGIRYPEVYWPHIVSEVLRECSCLPEPKLSELRFFYRPMPREPRLTNGAADALRALGNAGVILGLASNCQPYTLRELDSAMAVVGLSRGIFQTDLCFFSFEHGFSKPDPYAFRILATRLSQRGITPSETVMIGDRVDSDIEPAIEAGWHTWHLTKMPGGDWTAFCSWVASLGKI